MKIKIINSKYFTWYRRWFLNKIKKEITDGVTEYCCCIKSIFFFCCWKDLKEVQENLESNCIRKEIKLTDRLDCNHVWFRDEYLRLAFLQECINKTYV